MRRRVPSGVRLWGALADTPILSDRKIQVHNSASLLGSQSSTGGGSRRTAYSARNLAEFEDLRSQGDPKGGGNSSGTRTDPGAQPNPKGTAPVFLNTTSQSPPTTKSSSDHGTEAHLRVVITERTSGGGRTGWKSGPKERQGGRKGQDRKAWTRGPSEKGENLRTLRKGEKGP